MVFAIRTRLLGLHPQSLIPKEKDEKSPLHLSAPYRPAKDFLKKESSPLRKKILDALEKQMDRIFLNDDLSINFEHITDHILRRYFEDLATYYSATIEDNQNNEFLVKDLIRTELAKVLHKHRKKKILLIAHSMGSIIAYDVLTQVVPDIEIDTLVTIGSPLGIPIIIRKILAEQGYPTLEMKPTTPDNVVHAWYNFSDLQDKVVLDYNLSNDYQTNSRGIGPVDKVVYNNYENKGERYPHKSYGYLRTSEMADVIHGFLK